MTNRILLTVARRLRGYATLIGAALLTLVSRNGGAQSVAVADSAFARSDWPAASREYRAIAARDTANIRARFRLGVALFEQRQLRDAIPAFRHAVRAGFQLSQAEFRLSRSYAQLGQPDSALAHLERAITAGVSLQLVTSQPDLTPLRQDTRYLSMVQRLEDTTFPCRRGVEAHQFDFWIGDWVVTPWGTPASVPAIGHNTITAQLEHCLLLEEWTAANGSKGKSFNFWDTNRKAWRQVWTAGDGQSLDYEGYFSDNAMRFSGWTLNASGARVLQKLTFFRIAADTVRQLFEASSDGGATWQNTFDGRYIRTAGTGVKP
jgi:tetratricopeptide (TPR) repeat protein